MRSGISFLELWRLSLGMALLPSLDIVLFLSPENQRRGARAANLLLPVPGGEEGGPPLAMENQSATSFCRCSIFSLAFQAMWPDLLHCERGGCREGRRAPPHPPGPQPPTHLPDHPGGLLLTDGR